MYSISRDENIVPDFNMIHRVVDQLNEKFDPTQAYHHSSSEAEMFEFTYKTDNVRREAWAITFLGHVVVGGNEFGLDYSECQEDNYITLVEKVNPIFFREISHRQSKSRKSAIKAGTKASALQKNL